MPPEIDGGNTAAPAPILDVEPKDGRGTEDDILVPAIENLSPIEDADGAAAAAAEKAKVGAVVGSRKEDEGDVCCEADEEEEDDASSVSPALVVSFSI